MTYPVTVEDEPKADAKDEKAEKSVDLKAVHTLAMARFKIAEDAYSKQAQRELADLKFAARRGQWTKEELDVRQGIVQGNTTLGSRPSLTIDKLRQPIQQLENQQRQANLAVDVHPSGGKANAKTAEAIQGLYRHIQVTSRADQIARFWAYSRCLKVGRGCYRVEKVFAPFDPENDPPEAAFDQELKISRILNQAGVLLDPYAQEPDWSDGKFAFVRSWVSQSDYKKKNPKAKLANLNHEDAFALIGDQAPSWVKTNDGEGDELSILEVEYWYIETEKGETLTGPDGQTRTIETPRVYCCLLDGHEITERTEHDGRYIPLIPVVANEENIDGERIWEGLIAPAKESQRTYNFLTSAFVETVALAPRSPWLATVEQIGPFKAWWDQSNARNFPYLPYVAKTEGGNLLPPPKREFGEPPIQAIAQGIHQFDANINATTGFFDPSRGNLSSGERSGVALQALQKQTETGNSGYLDNLAQISMTYESKVILDLIPKVYDRPGRIARILGVDDAPSSVMLNQPFVKGPDGQPMAPPLDAPPQDILEYKLADGVYASTVTIGKSHTSAREAAAETIGQIIQAEPQLLMLIGDLYFSNLDGPGMPEMAARMKKMLPPQLQEQPGGAPDAAKLQQQIAQMTQQMQQMQPLADANQAKLQQAQMELQAKMQQAQIDAASKEKIAQLEAQNKRDIEQIKADALLQKARLDAMANTNAAAGQAQSDLQKTAMQEQSALQQQQNEHQFRAVEQVVEHGHKAEMADHEVANRPDPEFGG